MSFLLISDSYYPDHRSSGLIVKSLYQILKKNNYKCKVLSLIENNKFKSNQDLTLIKTNNFRKSNFIIRIIFTLFYVTKLIISLSKLKYNPKLIYIYYPSFILLLLIPFAKIKFKKTKILVHYQDHFPENAYDLKIIKSKIILNSISKVRKKILSKEIKIVVNSIKLKKNLKKLICNNDIYFFHNWPLIKKDNNSKKIKKFDKFTFIYTGNIGPAQEILPILNFFANTRLNLDLRIYADGRDFIKLKSNFSKIKNIHFNSFTNNNLSKIYQQSHASIISLSLKNKTSFIPSKFYDYTNHNLPIFALIHKECDLNSIIPKIGNGLAINHNEPMIIKKNIEKFIKNYKSYININNSNIFENNINIFLDFLVQTSSDNLN